MSKLICVKFTVGGNYNSTHDNLFVMIAAVASIMLKLAGREDLMKAASGSVCLIIILYWVSYVVLKGKY